jgi:colicin import membrane protein
MAERRVNTGVVVSGAVHAAVLLWAAVSFAAKPLNAPPTDSIFIETVSMSEFSQMMAGTKAAQKNEAPKPLVEKKAEPRPVENQAAPVDEKPEIMTASAASEPPPPQEKKPPPSKPAPREAREDPAEKKQPDAEALQKTEKKEAKKEPKKQEVKPLPPKKPQPKPVVQKPPVQEKLNFDADQIQALLDKRQPRRVAAAGDVLQTSPTLGAPRGSAPQLSQNEIDALRARIQQCWNPPAGQADARDLTVLVRIQFNPDGSLATDPRLLTRPSPGYQQVAAESALRAIRRCAPYSFMPPAKYEAWKDIEVNFDPRDLFRG